MKRSAMRGYPGLRYAPCGLRNARAVQATGESRMTEFKLGRAIVTRVEEVYGPTYPATQIFPDLNAAILAEHGHWLAPDHYEAETVLIKLSVHSWLLQIGFRLIVVGCEPVPVLGEDLRAQ